LGWRSAARRPRREPGDEPFASEIIAAVLGLLAFLLAFTFSLASDRYQARQDLASREVQAIRMAYVSATLLDETDQSQLRGTLRRYIGIRAAPIRTQAELDGMLARSSEVHRELTRIAAHVGHTIEATGIRAYVAQQLDDLVGLTYARLEIGERTRTPTAVIVTLFIVVAVAMFTIGWHAGERGLRRRHAAWALAVSFGAVMALISLLDRPANLVVRENQRLMVELQAWMDAQPAP
jgi:hypothetical protein